MKRIARIALLASLIIGLRLAVADSIDDAEAKRRGVPVEQIQLENAQGVLSGLQEHQQKLRDELAKLQPAPTQRGATPAGTYAAPGASSQPATGPASLTLDSVKEEIAQVQEENDSLSSQITAIKHQQAATDPKAIAAGLKLQKLSELKAAAASMPWGDAEKKKWLADGEKMVDVMDSYLKSHPRPREIEEALYNFAPKLGMTEEDVDAIARSRSALDQKNLVSESAGERIVDYGSYSVVGDSGVSVTVTFTKGVATSIQRLP